MNFKICSHKFSIHGAWGIASKNFRNLMLICAHRKKWAELKHYAVANQATLWTIKIQCNAHYRINTRSVFLPYCKGAQHISQIVPEIFLEGKRRSGGCAPSGVQGQSPWSGGQGAKSLWSWWWFT